MTIKSVLEQIDSMPPEEIGESQFLLQIKQQKPNLSKADKRVLLKEISEFRKFDVQHTLRRIFAYSIWCPDEAIEVARKKGVFRFKAWGLKSNSAEILLNHIQRNEFSFQYSEATRKFIITKLNLSWLFGFYQSSEKYLVDCIKKHHAARRRFRVDNTYVEEALFKELLAYVDTLFYLHKRSDKQINKNKLDGYGLEEIGESISYLIYLYDAEIGIKDDCHYMISTKYVLSNEIEDIILVGCKVHQMQEWELCIDYFDYDVKISENKYLIFDSENLFEKSIRLGYILRDMQEDLFYLKNKREPEVRALSLMEIGNYINNTLGNQLITSVGQGALSRYRFEFPIQLFSPFQDVNMFAGKFMEEELLAIGHCAKELIMSSEEALNKKITKNCTLRDVIMFQRFFMLMNIVAEQILFKQKEKNKILQSLIPAFQPDKLIEILTLFTGDRVKSEELINLFTYTKDVKLDLQYTPLLKVSNGIIFSTSLTANSNLLRNCIAYSYLSKNQVVNQEEREVLVDACIKMFTENHSEYIVFANKKFSYKNQDGEIDVLVISENDIIIIECKAPLSPTNNFEMRSSFDHIKKASKQLSHCKAALSDLQFKKAFLKNLGIEDTPRNIHTCIVFGNRLFNGYTVDSHPIRYIRELDMILTGGHIYSEVGTWRVWKNKKYNHSDLLSFLAPNYALGGANFEAMDKVEQYMFIKGKKICFETYVFNCVKAFRQYDDLFEVESENCELRSCLNSAYEEYMKQNQK